MGKIRFPIEFSKINSNPEWSTLGSSKSHVKSLDDPNFFCVDFVPKYCDNHVLEFAPKHIQYACNSCGYKEHRASLERLAGDGASSAVLDFAAG